MPFPAVLVSLDADGISSPGCPGCPGGRAEVEPRDGAGRTSWRDFYACSPYPSRVQRWSARSAEAFGNAQFLGELFIRRSGLLARCGEEDLATIRQQWGQSLFDQVRGGVREAPSARTILDRPSGAWRAGMGEPGGVCSRASA